MENRSGHIIRKRLGLRIGKCQVEPPLHLPSTSLVKPSNLPITRIAPSDVISEDTKIKPFEGSIDLWK